MDAGAMPTNLAQSLGTYFAAAKFEDLPRTVVEKAIEHTTYIIIRALQGHAHPLSVQARRIALKLNDHGGDTTIIGIGQQAQPIDAAFANTSMMRALECDENLFPIGVHAAIVVVPPAMALAERLGSTGEELITAIVSGYEVIAKLSAFGVRAWSAPAPRRETIVYGPFGGAVACGALMKLDADKMAHSIRYAAQSAMGVAEGTVWDHYYSLVSRNGMMCAMLAEEGAQVSPTVLEGRFGFFETFLSNVPNELRTWRAEGQRGIEMLGARTKRLPGTAWNVVPIEYMRDLVLSEGIRPENVERIDMALSSARKNFTLGHTTGPFETWRACSSAPFQMAMVLLDSGQSKHERYLQPENPEILDIIAKMQVVLEPDRHDDYTRIEVLTTDGRRLIREGHVYEYERWNDREELLAAGQGVLSEEKLSRAADMLGNLTSVGNVRELMACFRP